jgi:PAS domain S-box-containing protein
MTERKRLEQELAEREALLRAIIETEPECVKLLDLDGTVRTINAAGLAMIEATSSAEVVGRDVCFLVTAEFRSRRTVKWSVKAGRGEAGRLEVQIVGLLGTPRWLDMHVVPLRSADGTVTADLGCDARCDRVEKNGNADCAKAKTGIAGSWRSCRMPSWSTVRTGSSLINEQGLRLFGARSGEEILGKVALRLWRIPTTTSWSVHVSGISWRPGNTVPEVEEKIVRLGRGECGCGRPGRSVPRRGGVGDTGRLAGHFNAQSRGAEVAGERRAASKFIGGDGGCDLVLVAGSIHDVLCQSVRQGDLRTPAPTRFGPDPRYGWRSFILMIA